MPHLSNINPPSFFPFHRLKKKSDIKQRTTASQADMTHQIFNPTHNYKFTCVAKTSSSPTEKRTTKPYKLLKQKALKQNIAPRNVAPKRICNRNRGI